MRTFTTVLCCVLSITFCAAQQLFEYQERPDDPYLPMPKSERKTSDAFSFQNELVTTIQVNTDENGNNILNDAANEPSIAIDPNDPNRIVIGWRQFDNIESNFRQAGNAFTLDGGATWTNVAPIEAGIFRSDPVLDADSEGNFYYNSLSLINNVFTCDVFNTPDPSTWLEKTFAFGGDKQWMTIDKTGTESDGNIYENWTISFTSCDGSFTRSLDGGETYEPCNFLNRNLQWGTLTTDRFGTVYIAGIDPASGAAVRVIKSSNAKEDVVVPVWEDCGRIDLSGIVAFRNGPNPGGLLGQVWVASDNFSADHLDNLYVLGTFDASTSSEPADILFTRSTDGGETWSVPLFLDDDEPTVNNWQWFGTMSVAPNGRIDVIWLTTRSESDYESALFYTSSMDGGVTWMSNVQLSDYFDPHVGWSNQNKMGDYFDMRSTDEGAHLAWAATFNGEQDVYYSFISAEVETSTAAVFETVWSFDISPNPAKENALLSLAQWKGLNGTVEVLNLNGEVVYRMPIALGQQEIVLNTGTLNNGMYFVRLVDDAGGMQVRKMVVGQ